jgi:hypothetical protein
MRATNAKMDFEAFGVRDIEHTMYVRAQTRTDINEFQQHGLAIAYSGSKVRTELMVCATSWP